MAALAGLLLAMRAASDILSPVLLALVIAITTAPLLYWFIKKGASATLALFMTVVIFVVIILGIAWVIEVSLEGVAGSLPKYEARIDEITGQAESALDRIGVDTEDLESLSMLAPDRLLGYAASFASSLLSGISNLGLILLTGIFLLVEATALPRKIQSVFDKSGPGVQRLFRFNQRIRKYMALNAVLGLLAATLNVIFLLILGVDFALLWGVLSFFMSFIPNIGFIVSLVPPALMALIELGPARMLVVIVGYILINGVVDNILKPKLFQQGLSLSPAVTFLSLIVWGWVLGPIGAILSVPMAMVVQAVLESQEQTRWIAYMMSDGREPFNE